LWITSNQQNIFINFRQDFRASTRSDLFQGQTDLGYLFYWPNHSGKTRLSKLEVEVTQLQGHKPAAVLKRS
jgi:hypothetical protein